MNLYPLANTDLKVSRLAYGCMKLGGNWTPAPAADEEKHHAAHLIETALEQGINFFDHADIYTRGKSESVFGEILTASPGLRETIILQSKCGIRFPDDPTPGVPARYDFSYAHILLSVDNILARLQTEYLDILLLHRPDPLMEPEEVAHAFDELHASGKVRHFGVSNHTAGQIALLQKYLNQPLVANQVELNLLHSGLISEGILANQRDVPHTAAMGTLDYCRLHGIMIQAWAPVAGGSLIDPRPDADTDVQRDPAAQRAAALIARLAAEKSTTREAIALAWLLRHPAGIQPIIGTTNRDRLIASCAADTVALSREEWYALLVAARGKPVP
ncbi:MAG: aldo/keto reductase [Anaerolineales bacterium]|nr:aldo/keto reductase [Anaerolineales bacterium]